MAFKSTYVINFCVVYPVSKLWNGIKILLLSSVVAPLATLATSEDTKEKATNKHTASTSSIVQLIHRFLPRTCYCQSTIHNPN